MGFLNSTDHATHKGRPHGHSNGATMDDAARHTRNDTNARTQPRTQPPGPWYLRERNHLTFVTDPSNVTGMDSLLASAEISSSRDTRKQWNLIISRGPERIIVATYSRRNAEALADRLNELFTERPQLVASCEHCDMPIGVAPTGRPRRYCSDACRQAAWKLRHPPARTATELELAQDRAKAERAHAGPPWPASAR